MNRRRSLLELVAGKETIVVAGSGGVGKTSVAASIALYGAVALDAKVLVLTIDPARRLADALRVTELGNVEVRVPPEAFEEAGIAPRGQLWAAQLDTKRSWDDLVVRYAASEEEAFRILENPLYQGFSARFIQSHDYIALERLYELHSKGEYDLIVVDTPPTRNALDFVEAPDRVREFFGGRLLRWVTAPYRIGGSAGGRVINFAARPFFRVADQILGSQFLEDIAEFFLSFQSMYDGFVRRADAVQRLLRSGETSFVVVTTLESAAFTEARYFCRLLSDKKMPVGALLLNKVLPEYLLDTDAGRRATLLESDELAGRVAPLLDGVDARSVRRVLGGMAENFTNFQAVALREADEETTLKDPPDFVGRIPFVADELVDLTGLAALGQSIFGGIDLSRPPAESEVLPPPTRLEERRSGS